MEQHQALASFSPATRAWFEAAFAAPTAAQAGAWRAIGAGEHTLVVAPTGSGKTLAAFLAALDRLASDPPPADKRARCRVLYVSPLKALAVDVERNLRSPLAGIRQAAGRLGLPLPEVSVAVRSGDTPAADRRRFASAPADILITTPESLFLLLTSAAKDALRGVRTVIVDEVHAVAGAKRGAHLALTLERLCEQAEHDVQRIGLSATVRPVDEVAGFLGGGRPVTVVAPHAAKQVRLSVVVPVEDLAEIGQPIEEHTGSAAGAAPHTSIWPHVEERIVDMVSEHRSTIVFANSRRLAERLCGRLNEIAFERWHTAETAAEAGDAGHSASVGARLPAALMGAAGRSVGAPPTLARAHHGSVSKEARAAIEEELKAGRLPAVVATSSLELGIDMGAVDLVIQVESPPSVSSGLQRVGRAGHQVGAVSRGVIFPKYRGDLLQTAVVAERMAAGAIEALRGPRNPLDVLAQQIVAMVAMRDWQVAELLAVVRRARPFAELPTSAYEAVLDMLAGRYPSDEFAELRPRLVWDRVGGTLRARPGAQRLAVTSGGTIPDRGLFGVFLFGGAEGGPGRRVGELDEEMVYESRVGDTFTLGSSTWRIEDITHDRVLVTPAPGEPGKLPFWHGDAPGRPAELGRALGAYTRALGALAPAAAIERLAGAGLDEWAARNLVAYLAEQRSATGHVPDDRTIVVERFRDELGDWRVAIHSPFGAQVHAPWALAVAARLRERHGVDVQAMHADDGIVLRLPDTEATYAGGRGAPPAELAVFDPEEIESLVTTEVGGSALFAARFRECAARALLLPRRQPGRRTPLWQQRQRSAQLLAVASEHGSFPVVLETMRECLQDVFDVPGLVALMRDVAARRVRFVEVETPTPSPFARSLLFGYVAAFMYEGDSPLAERRAAALALDTTLLAELLGQAELRELLDPAALVEVEERAQRLAPAWHARDVEDVADLLRVLGPLSAEEAMARGARREWLDELAAARRAIRVRVAGEPRWAAIEDAGRLRDALGVALPVGVPEAFTEPVKDPLGDLVARHARTHGPFLAADVAARFGLGVAVVSDALARLAIAGRVSRGEFRPDGAGVEWCDVEMLRALRRRSLAALRSEAEPVAPAALARFLPAWQGVSSARRHAEADLDALVRAVDQLAGVPIPASALERLVLPARIAGYEPWMLDELCSAGEVVWAGAGAIGGADGWVALCLADNAPLLLPPPQPDAATTPLHESVLAALSGGNALFFRGLADRVGAQEDAALATALWDLVWAGLVGNDTLAPLRVVLGGARSSARTAARPASAGVSGSAGLAARHGRRAAYRNRLARGRPVLPSRSGPPTVGGRWSLTPAREADATRRAHALAEALLDRHGVLTRGAVAAEGTPGGFAAAYRVLTAFEETGRARRGYFVEGLGAAQFALPGAVDRLRALERRRSTPPAASAALAPSPWAAQAAGPGQPAEETPAALVLAATDPANPYGAALPWPERPTAQDAKAGHRPGRKAGALVVLVDGDLVLYVERGGRSLLTFAEEADRLEPAAAALADAVRDGALGRLTVERADGGAVADSALGDALSQAGFHATPRGLRLRG